MPEAVDDDLVATEPAAPTISRRGVLALVAGTSLTVFALTADEALGGVARRVALFGRTVARPESAPTGSRSTRPQRGRASGPDAVRGRLRTPDSPGRTCRSGRWWLSRPQCRESGIVDPPTWRSSQSLSSFPISFHQTPVAPAGVPHDV